VNRDPIGRRGGPNAYQYVYGDPCNGVDPIGLYVRVTGFTYFVVEIDKVPFWVNSGDFNQWWTSGRGRGRGYDKGVGGACQVYNANPRVGEPTDDKIFQRAAMAYMKNCLK